MGEDETKFNTNKQKVINRIKSTIASLVFFKDFSYQALPYDIELTMLEWNDSTIK